MPDPTQKETTDSWREKKFIDTIDEILGPMGKLTFWTWCEGEKDRTTSNGTRRKTRKAMLSGGKESERGREGSGAVSRADEAGRNDRHNKAEM